MSGIRRLVHPIFESVDASVLRLAFCCPYGLVRVDQCPN